MIDWQQQYEIIIKIACDFLSVRTGKMSQQRLADFLGVTKGKVRAWENGQRPSADDLELLARKMRLSPRWLLLGEGYPKESQGGLEDAQLPGTPAAEAMARYKEKQSLQVQPAPAPFAPLLPAQDPLAERVRVITDTLRQAGATDQEIRAAVLAAVGAKAPEVRAPSPIHPVGSKQEPSSRAALAAESSSPYGADAE